MCIKFTIKRAEFGLSHQVTNKRAEFHLSHHIINKKVTTPLSSEKPIGKKNLA
jgi:hypothetical protein